MNIRDKERYIEWQRKKMRERQMVGNKQNFGNILYRIGEASNPGPSHKGHSKHTRLGDFFHQHHTKKDDRHVV
eukprot:9488370-Heterocapsa_arctica.AAC.1